MHRAGVRDCNPSPGGRYYVGSTSVTKSGRTCQAWTSQSEYGDDRFPDGSVTSSRVLIVLVYMAIFEKNMRNSTLNYLIPDWSTAVT